MSFEVVGRLHKKFDTEKKTESFQAREFVIEVDGQYPQFVKFQLVQDRCSAIEQYNEGDMIKVSFDLRGREWQGKYFTNLNAWKIQANAPAAVEAGAPPPAASDGSFPSMGDAPTTAEDDLPKKNLSHHRIRRSQSSRNRTKY